MGSIGPAEILVVLVIALMVLGPTRLPDAARSLGKAVSEFRKVSSGLQSEVRDAFAEPPTYPKPEVAVDDPAPAVDGNVAGLSRPSPPHAEVNVVREPEPPQSA